MYKPYTIIGTNKQTYKYQMRKFIKTFFTVFWLLAVVVSRVGYLFGGRVDVVKDLYGLFADAMVRMEEGTPNLDSGLSYAYTRNLSKLLRFVGNRIEAVITYQMVLQILWLILLFVGISLLFGFVAGAVTGSILAASHGIIITIFTVRPENYYMLHFALALVLLGWFGRQAGKERWLANDLGRLPLVAVGFYVGVLCIWNILGFLLAFVMVYVLLRNYFSIRKQRLAKKDEKSQKPKTKQQVMGMGTQAVVLLEGILVGIFATLMKYTGVTGEAIVGQATWWFSQLKEPFSQYKEMQVSFICWLLGATTTGILCQFLLNQVQNFVLVKKKKEMWPEDEQVIGTSPKLTGFGKETEQEMIAQGEEGRYITTEDGRRIKLLDNPLPGPKKHVKREMDFDFDFEEEEKEKEQDDFDFETRNDDDFDI